MAVLDLKDKKLLVALSQNSRASHNQLGKAVGISKSAVPYRIKRLREEGIIRRFMTVVNLLLLDTPRTMFFSNSTHPKSRKRRFSTTLTCTTLQLGYANF